MKIVLTTDDIRAALAAHIHKLTDDLFSGQNMSLGYFDIRLEDGSDPCVVLGIENIEYHVEIEDQ